MTEPDSEPSNAPMERAHELERIVDGLDEKVAGEREAQGVPGKPSERRQAPVRGSEDEPPG